MSTRGEKSKPQTNRQLVAANTMDQTPKVNQRQEKFADFLIMGVILGAIMVGVPGIIFLIYCLTPKGRRWMKANNLL